MDDVDTIDAAAVDEDEQLDSDEGEGSDASEEGVDDDLADVYANPGDVISEPLR